MIHWIAALRLKTLPLALGAILLGSMLQEYAFDLNIFLWASSTAILLQVLSNLANDYGDFVKGTDRHRKDRQLGEGNITPRAMLVAIILVSVLTLIAGIYLLNLAFSDTWKYWFVFLAIGLLSIAAAILYTVGKSAYGYNGLGDVFVFIFFGLVGVLGSSFLFVQELQWEMYLPAISYGCLAMSVLNVNNIRDLDKDILTDKITLASKLGKQGALTYQTSILVIAFLSMFCYHVAAHYVSLAPIGILVLTWVNSRALRSAKTSDDYNGQLKMLSIGSLVVVILFILKIA
ncbi:MAG: 1,4-dihydroxy-2-naphthoate octaprenyltransferase [Bacteroidia bacterium]